MTNGRLQHIKELVRLGACDPHLDQTKLNDLLPLTIHGVLLDIVCAKLGGLCIANFAKELSPERAFDLLKVGPLGWLP